MKRLAVLLAVLGVPLAASDAASQALPELAAGQRVRVTAPEAGLSREIASLVALSAESLVVMPASGAHVRIALPAVRVLEAGSGQRSHVGLGMLLGALAGGTVGATYGYGQGNNTELQNWFCDHVRPCAARTAEGKAVLYGQNGALAGMLVGAVVGMLYRTERWVRVPLERMAVGVRPLPGGRTGLTLALPL